MKPIHLAITTTMALMMTLTYSQRAAAYASETKSSTPAKTATSQAIQASTTDNETYLSWVITNKTCGIKSHGEFTGTILPQELAHLCGEKGDSEEVKKALTKYKKEGRMQVAGFEYGDPTEEKSAWKNYKCAEEARLGSDGNKIQYNRLLKACLARYEQ